MNNSSTTAPAAFEEGCAVLWQDPTTGEQREAVFCGLSRGWATIAVADEEGAERKVRLSSLQPTDDSDVEPELADEQDDEQDDDGEIGSNLASQMRKYRAGYVPATNATGSKTLTNGDGIATALLRLLPLQVCAAADALFEQPAGYHAARYASLNAGQQRMNSGNRIRAYLRKAEDQAAALAAVDAAIAIGGRVAF